MRMTQSTSLHRDQISGDLIPVSQVNIPAREMAMLANLLLIILGILEVLFTLPSFIICLREICYCYSDSEVLMAAAAVAGSAEQERELKELFFAVFVHVENGSALLSLVLMKQQRLLPKIIISMKIWIIKLIRK